MNGVILNARRIRNSAIVEHGALLEVGSHRFLFEYATPPTTADVQDDPLLRHVRPTAALEETTDRNEVAPVRKQPDLAEANTSPLPPIALPPPTQPITGPVPLRLPSKPKNL